MTLQELQSLEWNGSDGYTCPCCEAYTDRGHAKSCALARELRFLEHPKLIFLDVDGVLNSVAYIKAHRPNLDHLEGTGARYGSLDEIDPGAVACLNAITDETEARIVLSASCRKTYDFPALLAEFEARGVRGEFIGRTPSSPNGHRGYEIRAYIKTLVHWPEAIVILDDGDDMDPLLPWLVKTDNTLGLIRADASRAVEILSKPFATPRDL